MWDLSSPPGIEPTPPALEDEVLTPGPPGSPSRSFLKTQSSSRTKTLSSVLKYGNPFVLSPEKKKKKDWGSMWMRQQSSPHTASGLGSHIVLAGWYLSKQCSTEWHQLSNSPATTCNLFLSVGNHHSPYKNKKPRLLPNALIRSFLVQRRHQ